MNTTSRRLVTRINADHARQRRAERDKITRDAGELATLWPHLARYALARDSASPSANDHHGQTSEHTVGLVNTDVNDARIDIDRWLHQLRGECVPLLKPDPRPYGPVQTILEVPTWWGELHRRNLPTAGYLYDDTQKYLEQARRAVGLITHDRRLAEDCPFHRDKPARLVVLGQEATLHEAILTAHDQTGRTWHLSTGAWVFDRSLTVRCPRCGLCWSDLTELTNLARMLADLERKATA